MRALPFLAALLFTAPLAGAKDELELLQDRCAEQERQIRQLEEENGRLKSLVTSATEAPTMSGKAQTATKIPDEAVALPPAGPAYGTVRKGDTISTVAKRHGTTTATIIKLNKLKNPSLIRPGQKLRLPDKAVASPASAVGHGTHVVKAGETFFSIARTYGLGPVALQAANPSVQADRLRPGQILQLGSKPAPEAPENAAPTPAKTSETPVPAEPASRTVSAEPRVRSVTLAENTNFDAFAAAHGTSIARLNALNALNLKSGTVLAKGSELYVPAQP